MANSASLELHGLVNGGLFYLFQDCVKSDAERLNLSHTDLEINTKLCADNLDAAISKLPLLLEASLDNMEALVFAGSVSMDNARAAIAWKLTSTAARLCMDTGLHQFRSKENSPEARRKRLLFWLIFNMDRGLALNFGRVPNIPY